MRRQSIALTQLARYRFVAFALSVFIATLARAAGAETLQAPVGGKPIPLPDGVNVCGALDHGWTLSADKRSVKPPATDAEIGQATEVAVAVDPGCTAPNRKLTLVATGPWPTIDAQSILISPDDGRVEARGTKLRGTIVRASNGAQTTEGVCDSPTADGAAERCVWNLGGATGPGTATAFSWAPAGARSTGQEELFDADGKQAGPERFRLIPARVALTALIAPEVSLDALAGTSTIPLRHSDAVASVDCAPAVCALEGSSIVVGSLPAGVSSLAVRVRLSPHVVLRRGEALESAPIFRVPVLRCPLAVVSGPPLRDLDNQRIVLRIEGRCAAEAKRLRFQVAGYQAERVRQVETTDALYVVLRLPQIDDDEVTVVATRDDGDAFVIAQARVKTRAVPAVRVALEIPTLGPSDFLPTNVDAVAHVSSPTWDGVLSVTPVDGLYSVRTDKGRIFVRGVSDAVGFVTLRVALRSSSLPPALADTDLAIVPDASQRAVHEANVPAPLMATPGTPSLVELLCDTGDGKPSRVLPGVVTHIPFDRKDSCRLVLHAERLGANFGTQKLVLEVDVVRVDGTPRVEARVSRTLTFAPSGSPRILWLHGAENRFDRFSIRVSHAADERHYVGASDSDIGLPAEQWTVITGRGSARVYATSAIPTGLYRVSDRAHSGILTLNFGVLARLTWLDSLGREGIVAAEGGVMAVGLANDVSSSGRSLTQVATVLGLGFSVPIANRALATETAINLHAWYEWEPSRALGGAAGNPSAFVFGPSISIGNIGADF